MNNQFQDPEALKKALNNMIKQAGGDEVFMPPEMPEAAQVMQIVSGLQEGIDFALGQISDHLKGLGQGLDLMRLNLFMITNILHDKGIVTEDEIKERYKRDVTDKMEEIRKLVQEKMKEEIDKSKEEVTREDPESNVVLPSERPDSKKVF